MTALEIVFGIVLLVFSLAIIIVVLLQEGSQKNVGVVTGGADTFLSKNKAKSLDAKLAKMTKWVAILWIIITWCSA